MTSSALSLVAVVVVAGLMAACRVCADDNVEGHRGRRGVHPLEGVAAVGEGGWGMAEVGIEVKVYRGWECQLPEGRVEVTCPPFSCCETGAMGMMSVDPVEVDCERTVGTMRVATRDGRCSSQAVAETGALREGECGRLNATHSVRWVVATMLPRDSCRIVSSWASVRGTTMSTLVYKGRGCPGGALVNLTVELGKREVVTAREESAGGCAECNAEKRCCPVVDAQHGCDRPMGYMRAFSGCVGGRVWSSAMVFRDAECTRYDVDAPVNKLYKADKMYTGRCYDVEAGEAPTSSMRQTIAPDEARYCALWKVQEGVPLVLPWFTTVWRKDEVVFDPATLTVREGPNAGMVVAGADGVAVSRASDIPTGAQKLTLVSVGNETLRVAPGEAERFMREIREKYHSSAGVLATSAVLLVLVALVF